MVSFNRRIVRVLEETGAVDLAVLAELAQVVSQGDESVTRYVLDRNLLDEDALLGVLADRLAVPPIDPRRITFPPGLTETVPVDVARAARCLPISKVGDQLTVAVCNPFDVVGQDDLRLKTGCELRLALTLEHLVEEGLERLYNEDAGRISEILDQVDPEVRISRARTDGEQVLDLDRAAAEGAEDAPVIRLVNLMIYNAIRERASDIHIEPFERRLRVRYRTDGALHDAMEPPRKLHNSIVSRVKILCGLDIAEKRRAQDGKFQARIEGRQVDFRVSTLPTVFGEKVVIRILDTNTLALALDGLGFEEKALRDFREAIHSAYGMILVTGPTGSGKTTTLYAAVKEIYSDEKNFVTVEDPVEYQLDGISQVPVNPKGGVTFASALRAILRQDPDTVMVGEIRDGETIDIAIKAALTGHLVLSTLHTNDASSTITRMVDMGVDPFMVASATVLVSAQRLIRRLCSHCRRSFTPPRERLLEVGYREEDLAEEVVLFEPGACPRCRDGYAGRFALLETLPMGDDIKRMVVEGRSALEIRQRSLALGMISLRRTALSAALRGDTSIEEVLRVTLADGGPAAREA